MGTFTGKVGYRIKVRREGAGTREQVLRLEHAELDHLVGYSGRDVLQPHLKLTGDFWPRGKD